MERLKKILKWLKTPIYYPLWINFLVAIFVLVYLYRVYPILYVQSLPDLIATFLGVLIGFTLAAYQQERFRQKDIVQKEEIENIKFEKNKDFIINTLNEEIGENYDSLMLLKDIQTEDTPKIFLRTSSWQTAQNYLDSFDDFTLIEQLYELYFKIEDLNRDIEYLRRHVFFGISLSPSTDPTRMTLAYDIRRKSSALALRCKELSIQ